MLIELIVDLLYSLLRLFSAYILSISVALVIGISMARSKVLEAILYPIIDVLQSIPVLGFFPAVLLFLINIFPPYIGVEMASIILIFTGQVWNLILGVYSAIKSLPSDFILLSEVYSLNTTSRILKIYTPAALFAIASNSVVSWAGGLFFLTACEIISFGNTEYRLRGIGTAIIELASKGDYIDMYIAIILLLAISILLYIFLWNPLANIAANISGGSQTMYPAINLFLAMLPHRKIWKASISDHIIYLSTRIDIGTASRGNISKYVYRLVISTFIITLIILSHYFLRNIPLGNINILEYPWTEATIALLLSLSRVTIVIFISFIVISLAAFYVYEKSRYAKYILVILSEILSSIPAFLWWPIFSLALLNNILSPLIVSLFIMFQGTAWYIVFNVPLSPPSESEKRLLEMASVYRLPGLKRFSKIFIPSMMPRILAGLSAAWGGAWNSTIAAEYARFGNITISFYGIGYLLNEATNIGNMGDTLFYAIYLALFIVIVNRTLWHWLYDRAFIKYRVVD